MFPEPFDFDAQTKRWQQAGLDAPVTEALRAMGPAQAPGNLTARTLARLATWRFESERRQRMALRLLLLAFVCILIIWLFVVALETGIGSSLAAVGTGMLVAASYAWDRWQVWRKRH